MSIIEAIFLGIVQGLTEFLPISSSGHLMLISELFGIESSLSFTVWLHVGTLVAVCVFYRKTIFHLVTHPKDKRLLFLIIASVPTFIIAAAFKFFVPEEIYRILLPLGFLITIVLMFFSDRFKGDLRTKSLGVRRSVITGAVQGVAVIAGLSRSGATIFALTSQGVKREDAGEFSFLLSIPIILAGGLTEGYGALKNGGMQGSVLPTIIGVITAAAVGFLAIKLMINLLARGSMKYFALYLLIPLLLSILTL